MAKYTGKGAEFQVQTVASPSTWVSIAQIREIGSATITSSEIEATTLDDNVSGLPTDYEDFLPGFKDPGEMPITLMFDPALATHGSLTNGVYELFDSGRTLNCRVKYPTSPTYYMVMSGFFRDWETPTFNASDPVESTFTFRIRQKPQLNTTGELE